MLALFAGLDRMPHVWALPGFDEPADLAERLLANGFSDEGGGLMMVLDPDRAGAVLPTIDPSAAAGRTIVAMRTVSAWRWPPDSSPMGVSSRSSRFIPS